MLFLGKIFLESGGKRLGVQDDGKLAMLPLQANDPAGQFLAYDVGGGWFSLQSYLGFWVQLSVGQSHNSWYPVLYSAKVGPSPTRLARQFFDAPNGRAKFAFQDEDSGVQVSLLIVNGINSYCSCEFDVGTSWNYGLYFGMGLLAPGVEQLQESKEGASSNFSCLGSACVNFSNAVFTGVNFQNANFSGANLTDASFAGCTLNHAVFSGANLAFTDFRNAFVAGADFSGCDLTGGAQFPDPPLATNPSNRTILRNAIIPASLLKLNWSYLDLTNAQIQGLEGTDLQGLVARYTLASGLILNKKKLMAADFSNSDLTGAQFQGSDLKEAQFHSSILSGCRLSKSILISARFDPDISSPNPASTDLIGARFSGADLSNASLRSAILWGALFTAAVMKETDLTQAQIGNPDFGPAASFSFAYMENARLDGVNAYGVNFSYVTFFGPEASATQTSTMEQSDFSNAFLAGVDFTGANLRGAKFIGACLINACLRAVNLQPSVLGNISASLAGAVLQGAEFKNSKLNFADLSNAGVELNPGNLPVRYCDQEGVTYPPAPKWLEVGFFPTTDLDLNTMGEDTICPNGYTVSQNQFEHLPIYKMLESPNAPHTWLPAQCGPAAEEDEGI
ncbi:MAG: pentapeptide repeat-containing protein [Terracidiphilus sp.]|jgi:uncharacterized protein YjbI with pentapeptide repeats